MSTDSRPYAVVAPSHVRRAAQLWLDLQETLKLDATRLLRGETGLQATMRWQAWLPARQQTVVLDTPDLAVLQAISEVYWCEIAALAPAIQLRIPGLLDSGLLVAQIPDTAARRLIATADQRLRDGHWHPLSSLNHAFGRWEGQHHGEDGHLNQYPSLADMIAAVGAPPPAQHSHLPADQQLALPPPRPSGLDGLLAQRRTARNFDRSLPLPLATLADVLAASFGVRGIEDAAPGAAVFKKSVPSGGALHPIEAYLLVQHVDGLAPGLYHYDALAHALEPMPTTGDLATLASRFVAGQLWFADAHVQIALVARFQRNFWKYRRHSKAYRALALDAGHLSQMIYLAATERAAGAFITAAINEIEIEQALGLDPLLGSPLAVCGIGVPAVERRTREFDPAPMHR